MSSITRTRYGRYQTLFRIAGGGMAEVWAARVVGEGGFQKLPISSRPPREPPSVAPNGG